jgi:hypothetical protein
MRRRKIRRDGEKMGRREEDGEAWKEEGGRKGGDRAEGGCDAAVFCKGPQRASLGDGMMYSIASWLKLGNL